MTRLVIPDIWLPMFKKGEEVRYNGKRYTISHVTVSGYDLWLHFDYEEFRVNSRNVYLAPTKISNNDTTDQTVA